MTDRKTPEWLIQDPDEFRAVSDLKFQLDRAWQGLDTPEKNNRIREIATRLGISDEMRVDANSLRGEVQRRLDTNTAFFRRKNRDT